MSERDWQEIHKLRAEVKRLREQHERDLIHVREAHQARRMAEAEIERLRNHRAAPDQEEHDGS